MAEGFLLPSFKEQRALKLKSDKKQCLEFIKEYIHMAERIMKRHSLIRYYENIPFSLNPNMVMPLIKTHYKNYYTSLRNKGWYIKVEYFDGRHELIIRKANLFNRLCWQYTL